MLLAYAYEKVAARCLYFFNYFRHSNTNTGVGLHKLKSLALFLKYDFVLQLAVLYLSTSQ